MPTPQAVTVDDHDRQEAVCEANREAARQELSAMIARNYKAYEAYLETLDGERDDDALIHG